MRIYYMVLIHLLKTTLELYILLMVFRIWDEFYISDSLKCWYRGWPTRVRQTNAEAVLTSWMFETSLTVIYSWRRIAWRRARPLSAPSWCRLAVSQTFGGTPNWSPQWKPHLWLDPSLCCGIPEKERQIFVGIKKIHGLISQRTVQTTGSGNLNFIHLHRTHPPHPATVCDQAHTGSASPVPRSASLCEAWRSRWAAGSHAGTLLQIVGTRGWMLFLLPSDAGKRVY